MRIHPMRSDMQKEILTIVEGRRLIDEIEARDSDVIVTEKREIQLSNILKHYRSNFLRLRTSPVLKHLA